MYNNVTSNVNFYGAFFSHNNNLFLCCFFFFSILTRLNYKTRMEVDKNIFDFFFLLCRMMGLDWILLSARKILTPTVSSHKKLKGLIESYTSERKITQDDTKTVIIVIVSLTTTIYPHIFPFVRTNIIYPFFLCKNNRDPNCKLL